MDISGHEGEIPIPLTSTYVTRAPPPPPPPPLHPHLHKTEDQSPTTILAPNNKKLVEVGHGHPKIVKYKECLKNHAAAMGGNATDGCGEFMPSGEEGTLEAFKCSACNCHRNFHRKAVQGEIAYSFGYIHRPHPPPALIMPLGAMYTTTTTTTTSESEEMEDAGYGGGVSGGNTTTPLMVKKRRFRTKFTQEQKEKMLDFADKFGWKLPRQEEGLVQSFCQEIGVKRRVLKVWMHNNKHSLGKIKAITPES